MSEQYAPVATAPVAAALIEAVADFGRQATTDPGRVRALLSDALGADGWAHRAEIDALVVAVEESVPSDLLGRLRGTSTVSDGELLSRLSGRGLDDRMGQFALGTWGASLGAATSVPNPLASDPLPAFPATGAVAGVLSTSEEAELVPAIAGYVDPDLDWVGTQPDVAVVPAVVPPADADPGPTVEPRGRRQLVIAAVIGAVLIAGGAAWGLTRTTGTEVAPTAAGRAGSVPAVPGASPGAADQQAIAAAAASATAASFDSTNATKAAAAATTANDDALAASRRAAKAAQSAQSARANHQPTAAKNAAVTARTAAKAASIAAATAATASRTAAAAAIKAEQSAAAAQQVAGSLPEATASAAASTKSASSARAAATTAASQAAGAKDAAASASRRADAAATDAARTTPPKSTPPATPPNPGNNNPPPPPTSDDGGSIGIYG